MKHQKTLNNSTKFWLKQFPSRYIAVNPKQNMLRFDGGESFVPKTTNIEPLLDKIQTSDLMNYTEPSYIELKKEISKTQSIPTNQITVSAGADELIESIPRIILNPGDNVIVITPTFFRFIESSLRLKANIIEIQTKQSENYEINEKVIEKVIKTAQKKEVKLIWIATPNNPTGNVVKPVLIKQLLNKIKSFVVVDEVLHGFLDPEHHQSNKNLVKSHKNVIILGSISKIYGLAGIRVGWGIANKEIIQILEKWRLPYNISTPSMKVAIDLLRLNNEDKMREAIDIERNFILERIKKISKLEIKGDSEINILLIRHKNKDLFKELKRKDILTADFREANGLHGENFIRISVQNREKNIKLINALKEIC